MRFKSLKYLEENISITLHDIDVRSIFKGTILYAKQIEVKVNKVDYIKLRKKFCTKTSKD